MIATLLLTAFLFFALPFFSAENLVTVIGGAIVSVGFVQWFKNKSGVYGPVALIAAVITSLVIALVAVVVSAYMNGTELDWSRLPQIGTQLFALATVGYKLLVADAGQD